MPVNSNKPKGKPRGASRKGIPNAVPKELKQMILDALSRVGGELYLAEQAEKNPTAFMTLIGKVLPMQVTGENGAAIVVTWQK